MPTQTFFLAVRMGNMNPPVSDNNVDSDPNNDTPPAPAEQRRRMAKRQADETYMAASNETASDQYLMTDASNSSSVPGCGAASIFVIYDGQISSGNVSTGGQITVGTNWTIGSSPTYGQFAANRYPALITRTWVYDGQFLQWNNASFGRENNTAYFCKTEDDRVYVLYDGQASGPADCALISLTAIPAAYCVNDTVVYPSSSSAVSTPTATSSVLVASTTAIGSSSLIASSTLSPPLVTSSLVPVVDSTSTTGASISSTARGTSAVSTGLNTSSSRLSTPQEAASSSTSVEIITSPGLQVSSPTASTASSTSSPLATAPSVAATTTTSVSPTNLPASTTASSTTASGLTTSTDVNDGVSLTNTVVQTSSLYSSSPTSPSFVYATTTPASVITTTITSYVTSGPAYTSTFSATTNNVATVIIGVPESSSYRYTYLPPGATGFTSVTQVSSAGATPYQDVYIGVVESASTTYAYFDGGSDSSRTVDYTSTVTTIYGTNGAVEVVGVYLTEDNVGTSTTYLPPGASSYLSTSTLSAGNGPVRPVVRVVAGRAEQISTSFVYLSPGQSEYVQSYETTPTSGAPYVLVVEGRTQKYTTATVYVEPTQSGSFATSTTIPATAADDLPTVVFITYVPESVSTSYVYLEPSASGYTSRSSVSQAGTTAPYVVDIVGQPEGTSDSTTYLPASASGFTSYTTVYPTMTTSGGPNRPTVVRVIGLAIARSYSTTYLEPGQTGYTSYTTISASGTGAPMEVQIIGTAEAVYTTTVLIPQNQPASAQTTTSYVTATDGSASTPVVVVITYQQSASVTPTPPTTTFYPTSTSVTYLAPGQSGYTSLTTLYPPIGPAYIVEIDGVVEAIITTTVTVAADQPASAVTTTSYRSASDGSASTPVVVVISYSPSASGTFARSTSTSYLTPGATGFTSFTTLYPSSGPAVIVEIDGVAEAVTTSTVPITQNAPASAKTTTVYSTSNGTPLPPSVVVITYSPSASVTYGRSTSTSYLSPGATGFTSFMTVYPSSGPAIIVEVDGVAEAVTTSTVTIAQDAPASAQTTTVYSTSNGTPLPPSVVVITYSPSASGTFVRTTTTQYLEPGATGYTSYSTIPPAGGVGPTTIIEYDGIVEAVYTTTVIIAADATASTRTTTMYGTLNGTPVAPSVVVIEYSPSASGTYVRTTATQYLTPGATGYTSYSTVPPAGGAGPTTIIEYQGVPESITTSTVTVAATQSASAQTTTVYATSNGTPLAPSVVVITYSPLPPGTFSRTTSTTYLPPGATGYTSYSTISPTGAGPTIIIEIDGVAEAVSTSTVTVPANQVASAETTTVYATSNGTPLAPSVVVITYSPLPPAGYTRSTSTTYLAPGATGYTIYSTIAPTGAGPTVIVEIDGVAESISTSTVTVPANQPASAQTTTVYATSNGTPLAPSVVVITYSPSAPAGYTTSTSTTYLPLGATGYTSYSTIAPSGAGPTVIVEIDGVAEAISTRTVTIPANSPASAQTTTIYSTSNGTPLAPSIVVITYSPSLPAGFTRTTSTTYLAPGQTGYTSFTTVYPADENTGPATIIEIDGVVEALTTSTVTIPANAPASAQTTTVYASSNGTPLAPSVVVITYSPSLSAGFTRSTSTTYLAPGQTGYTSFTTVYPASGPATIIEIDGVVESVSTSTVTIPANAPASAQTTTVYASSNGTPLAPSVVVITYSPSASVPVGFATSTSTTYLAPGQTGYTSYTTVYPAAGPGTVIEVDGVVESLTTSTVTIPGNSPASAQTTTIYSTSNGTPLAPSVVVITFSPSNAATSTPTAAVTNPPANSPATSSPSAVATSARRPVKVFLSVVLSNRMLAADGTFSGAGGNAAAGSGIADGQASNSSLTAAGSPGGNSGGNDPNYVNNENDSDPNDPSGTNYYDFDPNTALFLHPGDREAGNLSAVSAGCGRATQFDMYDNELYYGDTKIVSTNLTAGSVVPYQDFAVSSYPGAASEFFVFNNRFLNWNSAVFRDQAAFFCLDANNHLNILFNGNDTTTTSVPAGCQIAALLSIPGSHCNENVLIHPQIVNSTNTQYTFSGTYDSGADGAAYTGTILVKSTSGTNFDVESCFTFCASPYPPTKYTSVETHGDGRVWCYCSNDAPNFKIKVTNSYAISVCPGNRTEACGGYNDPYSGVVGGPNYALLYTYQGVLPSSTLLSSTARPATFGTPAPVPSDSSVNSVPNAGTGTTSPTGIPPNPTVSQSANPTNPPPASNSPPVTPPTQSQASQSPPVTAPTQSQVSQNPPATQSQPSQNPPQSQSVPSQTQSVPPQSASLEPSATPSQFMLMIMRDNVAEYKRAEGENAFFQFGGYSPNCEAAEIFHFDSAGHMFADTELGVYSTLSQFSVAPQQGFQIFEPQSNLQSITTTFSSRNGGYLYWSNPDFVNGHAAFCSLLTGATLALFDGLPGPNTLYPTACSLVSLYIVGTEYCVNNVFTPPPGFMPNLPVNYFADPQADQECTPVEFAWVPGQTTFAEMGGAPTGA